MRYALAILACATILTAADWLTDRGGIDRSGRQTDETQLTPATAKDIQLLWKLRLETGKATLSAPTILGPFFTHRGIKELVFVTTSSDTLYAIDADLGRIFWTRHIVPGAPAKSPCGPGVMAPVISHEPDIPNADKDLRSPIRPITFVTSDGVVHKISPTTGLDLPGPSMVANPCNSPAEPDPKVIGNGVVYLLTPQGVLTAADAATGKPLYSSGAALTGVTSTSNLALANGHLCFTANNNTLYCFGLYLEI